MSGQSIMLELPESVYLRLEKTIQETVVKVLQANLEKIQAEPKMLSRSEASKKLRVTPETLRQWELSGKLVPSRAGRRILYDKRTIELFLKT